MQTNSEFLRDFIQHEPIAIGGVDETGTKFYFNDFFVKTFGWTQEDIPSLDIWFSLAYPDETYRQYIIELWETMVERAARLNLSYSDPEQVNITCKNGSVKTCEFRHFEKGDMQFAVFYDVTERENMRDMLVESQHITKLGSWSLDHRANELKWSSEIYNIFEIDREKFEPNYEGFLNSIHPDDRTPVNDVFLRSLNSKLPYSIEHRLLMDDGRIKYVHEQGRTIYDNNGQPLVTNGIVYDVTARKLDHIKVENLTYFDPLTGLPNKQKLISDVDQIIQTNQRNNEKRRCALFMIDIDNFSRINNSFGHDVGDEILIEIGDRLQRDFSSAGYIASLSSDEFVILVQNMSSREEVELLAASIQSIVSDPFHTSRKLELYLTISIGIVSMFDMFYPAKQLLLFADVALHRAKDDGRNTFRFYEKNFSEEIQEKVQLQNELYEALIHNELTLYYQPQTFIKNNKIIGAEALIRWKHPKKGYISPSAFIPLAENSNLISSIGKWVIREACEQAKIWHDKGIDIHLSINISAHQLKSHDLLDIIDKSIIDTGVDPKRLIVELTESALANNIDELLKILHEIKARGISIAIDDFGTGYSSYSYLKRFPIDYLKIDKSFIDNIPYRKDDIAIIKAIISMAKALEFQIIAEGVETQEQFDFLYQNQCEYYQGYFRSKPVDVVEFEKLMLG